MKNHKSMRGISIDVNKLMSQQEQNITIGNTRSNARGDQLGRGGRVIKGADEIAREHYNNNNPRAVKQGSIKIDDADVKRRMDAAKSSPDPIVDDWAEPVATEEPQSDAPVDDDWVEDADGNFIRKDELKETTSSKSRKPKKSEE